MTTSVNISSRRLNTIIVMMSVIICTLMSSLSAGRTNHQLCLRLDITGCSCSCSSSCSAVEQASNAAVSDSRSSRSDECCQWVVYDGGLDRSLVSIDSSTRCRTRGGRRVVHGRVTS